MNFETVELIKKDKVATIKLNRPDKLNAFNEKLRTYVSIFQPYDIEGGSDFNPHFTSEIRYTLFSGLDMRVQYKEFNFGQEYQLGLIYFL